MLDNILTEDGRVQEIIYQNKNIYLNNIQWVLRIRTGINLTQL